MVLESHLHPEFHIQLLQLSINPCELHSNTQNLGFPLIVSGSIKERGFYHMDRCTMVTRKLKCKIMRHTVILNFLLVFWWLTLARISKWSSLVVGVRVITWVNQNLGASFLLLFALQFLLLLPCLPFSIWHLIITWFRVVIIILVFLFLAYWATWLIFRFTIIILVLVLVFLTRRIDGTLGRVFARNLLLFSKRLSSNTEIQVLIPIERINTRPRGGE